MPVGGATDAPLSRPQTFSSKRRDYCPFWGVWLGSMFFEWTCNV